MGGKGKGVRPGGERFVGGGELGSVHWNHQRQLEGQRVQAVENAALEWREERREERYEQRETVGGGEDGVPVVRRYLLMRLEQLQRVKSTQNVPPE